ncbi:SocA family protein [bacterium]|nr:SocA family protein [bacterium]
MNPKQEKLLNAIIFFVKNTKNCGKMKLFKLLYFTDFIHFKRYGITVTGMEYCAWKMGPVPKKLYEDMASESNAELNKFINIVKLKDEDDPERYEFKLYPKIKEDLNVFSPNEIEIMKEVAFTFMEATATQMSEITHLKNSPWDKTIKNKGLNFIIDYELAIDEDTTLTLDEIRQRHALEKEFDRM